METAEVIDDDNIGDVYLVEEKGANSVNSLHFVEDHDDGESESESAADGNNGGIEIVHNHIIIHCDGCDWILNGWSAICAQPSSRDIRGGAVAVTLICVGSVAIQWVATRCSNRPIWITETVSRVQLPGRNDAAEQQQITRPIWMSICDQGQWPMDESNSLGQCVRILFVEFPLVI